MRSLLLALRAALTLSLCTTLVLAKAQAPVDVLVSEQLASVGRADVLVVYGDFPDLSSTAALATKAEKAWAVYTVLRRNATRHAATLDLAARRGLATQHLWAANAVCVYAADARTVEQLRHVAQVERVAAVPTWSIDQLELEPVAPDRPVALSDRSVTPTWGLRFLGVPEVWAEGIRGQGAVVGGADTGYDWTHPALRPSYRGAQQGDSVRHDYHWYDGVRVPFPGEDDANPCGFGVRYPCDDGSHGTHTMGTMVGETADELIGVAPEASWIGCRNMDRGNGTPVCYLACFQFFLAPTNLDGANPRPELGPDVIANSWYCPLSEGCDSSTYPAFDNAVAALRAAGTVVVASAGNAGSRCNTVSDIPARVKGAFVVGAHDSLGRIAGFSSRGYYRADPDRVRPDVALPGVAVRSSIPNSAYTSYNGTSMSGPHAVGVFALMISANPALRGQVDTLEALFRRSATPTPAPANDTCSAPGVGVPNAVFGYGLGNAQRAVELAQAWRGVVGVAEAEQLHFTLAPNPTRGDVRVRLSELPAEAELVVTDVMGRELLRWPMRSTEEEVSASAWAPGLYFVTVRSPGQRARTLRLVVER